MCGKTVIAASVLGTGLVLTALGAGLGWGLFPGVVEKAIGEGVALVNGSDAWGLWVKLPIPLNFKVYLFNVTNPEEVTAGAKPIVEEKGPYIYNEYKEKNIMEIHTDEPWVTYDVDTHFEFNQELSGDLKETDIVTILNPALMGALLDGDLKDDGEALGVTSRAIPDVFDGTDNVFVTATVGEILFYGIRIRCTGAKEKPIVNAWRQFCREFAISGTESATIRRDPLHSEDFLYSFFAGKEMDLTDGVYTVNTGVKDARMLGKIHKWNNSTKLNFWAGEECQQIKGTDAAIFPPFLTRERRAYIFSTDLCRSLYAEYLEDMEHKGVQGYRLVASEEQLATVEDNPENYCYCGENSGCLKRGSLDLQACVNGPLILTFPHFYQSSPDYLDSVEGLNPTQDEHQTFLDVEPNTGVPLGGGKRVQFNMMIKPVPGVEITKYLPNALVPIFWIDEGVELDDENTELLKAGLKVLVILDGIAWGLIGVGLALCLAGSCYLIIHYAKLALIARKNRPYDYGTKVEGSS